jgi:hypothetical protein
MRRCATTRWRRRCGPPDSPCGGVCLATTTTTRTHVDVAAAEAAAPAEVAAAAPTTIDGPITACARTQLTGRDAARGLRFGVRAATPRLLDTGASALVVAGTYDDRVIPEKWKRHVIRLDVAVAKNPKVNEKCGTWALLH